jgi:hypothetical protein
MRKLTDFELQIIAGGYNTLDRVTVTVPSPPPAPAPDPFEGLPDNGDGGGNDSGGGGGGDPDPEPELPCTCPHTPEATENAVDAAAAKITQEIMRRGDMDLRESFGAVYRDANGVIRTTTVAGGEHQGHLNQDTLYNTLESYGINKGNLLALVHNHPAAHVASQTAENGFPVSANFNANQLPSENDWNFAAANIRGDGAATALYVIGPDRVLREYDVADRAFWDAQRDSVDRTRRVDPGATLSTELPPPPACPKHGG